MGVFLITAALTAPALAVGRFDLSPTHPRPAHVKITDRDPTSATRAVLQITNRGSAAAVFRDTATLAAVVPWW